MGLISALITAPIAPLRGVVAAARQIEQQAEDEFYDPVTIRRQIEQVERLRADGALSEDEAVAWEDELVERLIVARGRPQRER
jgi:hypothetical protein